MQEMAKVDEEKKIGMTEAWLRKHRPVYNAATKHPFIRSIRDGTVQIHSFKTWLVSQIPLPPFLYFLFFIFVKS
jgi:hypothetical protein